METPTPSSPPSAGAKSRTREGAKKSDAKRKRLLLIGWDAADWKLITPLLDAGKMPALERLIHRGVMGNIATLEPILSPMLWNSIATGKRADEHGILGFTELDPNTGAVRPVTSTSRRCKALWNICTQRGLCANVVGWFAGHPAEPINGVAVSDLYPHATAPRDQPWPLPEGAVHPAELRETLAGLRMHPLEVQPAAVLAMIPRAAEIDHAKDHRLRGFMRTLAETCTIHNAATWILQNQPWELTAVYFNGIDHFCHQFMIYHPPRLPGVPEDLFNLYKGVVAGAYRFHDMMLETLVGLAGPEAHVMLLSDHGFHADHLRPREIPEEPAGPTVQHRRLGIFCLAGPGIRRDERIYGATLLDVAPTALALLGLPVGEDMPGRVLAQAWERPPAIERIPSWEAEAGECGMHAADQRMDPATAEAVMRQFIALGYIQAPGAQEAEARAATRREQQYNLGRAHLGAGRPAEALAIFLALGRESPEQARFGLHLAQCYLSLRRFAEARWTLEGVLEREESALAAPPAAAAGEAGKNASGGGEAAPAARGNPAMARAALRAWADGLLGAVCLGERDYEGALLRLRRASAADPGAPRLHQMLGEAYLRLGRDAEALRAFDRALELDGDMAEALRGQARVHLRRRRPELAVEAALRAVGMRHYSPAGHYLLGLALARCGDFERAALAFETALSQAPRLRPPRRALIAIHQRPGGDAAKAAAHREWLAAHASGGRARAAGGGR